MSGFGASLLVVAPGLLSTVQDLGRKGTGAMGVAPSGAVDWFSARAANRLAGNADAAPLIETTLTGAAFEACADIVVAVTGAAAALTIGGRWRSCWRSWEARAGDAIVVGPAQAGLRSYIAIGGGIGDMPLLMGSAATDVAGGFGGRILAAGDRLCVGASADLAPRGAFAYPCDAIPLLHAPAVLRVLLGPHAERLGSDVIAALLATEYRASARSSRQALRLAGTAVETPSARDAVSAGLCAGCVQVTGAGLPVVMLAEHQTTGGYAVACCVIWADVPRAAQAAPGDTVRFELVSIDAAHEAFHDRAATLRALAPLDAGVAREASVDDRLARGFFEGMGH